MSPRFCEPLHAVARRVILWAQPELLELLTHVVGIDKLLPLHDGVPEADFEVDIESMEMPAALGFGTHPWCGRLPYLRVPPTSPQVAERDGHLNVGLQWRGGNWDQRRSISPSLLSRLLATEGVRFYSLQFPTATLPAQLAPLAQRSLFTTARAMVELDLVISIDSVSAHLAGALCVPTRVLLPAECDWRWQPGEQASLTHSHWYPGMRLFRQRQHGDWIAVLEEVRAELHVTRRLRAARDTR